MTWHIDGTGNDLTFGIRSYGGWTIRGHGVHQSRPNSGDMDFLPAVQQVPEMSWTLYSPNTTEEDVSTVSPGLWSKFQHDQKSQWIAISYFFDANPAKALLTAEVILHPDIAVMTYDLLKAIWGTSARYRLLMRFEGLRTTNAPSNDIVPTVGQFMDPDVMRRRPAFSQGFTLIFPDKALPN